MMAYIRGVLAEKEPGRAVVEAGGIGYEMAVSLSTYDTLPKTGCEVKLLLWHCVRDDGESLFAFATPEERGMFAKLTSVGGVGPKLAMAVLSGASAGELAFAISGGDAKRISAIKGVGRKTAEKICVELRDKVDALGALAAMRRGGAGGFDAKAPAVRDAILALSTLGYGEETAGKMVSDALRNRPGLESVEEIVRAALSSKK